MKIKEIKIVNQDGSTELANIGADAINVDYNNTTVKAELDKLNNNNNVNKNNITNLQTELSTANSNLELQTSRIDNLVHLDEGSTTGDAELIDGRTGYNGKNYTSIGNAIRKQVSNIHNIFQSMTGIGISEPLEEITGYLYFLENHDLYIVSNGYTNKYKILPGVDYYITASYKTQDAGFPAIVYLDENSQFISYQFNTTPNVVLSLNKQKITIPDGAAYFYASNREQEPLIETAFSTWQGLDGRIQYLDNTLTGQKVVLKPWEYKKNVYITGNSKYGSPAFISSDIRSRINIKPYASTFIVTPNEGFLLSCLAIYPDGNSGEKIITGWTSDPVTVIINPNNQYWVTARKEDNSAFAGNEDIATIQYLQFDKLPLDEYIQKTDKLINVLYDAQGQITPNQIYTNSLYNIDPQIGRVWVANGNVYKYNIDDISNQYYVTSMVYGQTPGFDMVIYFDENGAYISSEYPNAPSQEQAVLIENRLLNIPENTSYFYVNARGVIPAVSNQILKSKNQKKTLSILFVGNSLTQDGIAYLPYMLKKYYGDEIDFKIYMWYCGGYTLAQHYEKFINDQNCEIFSVAENTAEWTNSAKKMSYILSTYKFDVVCMQEYFNYKESFDVENLVDWNNCQNYIREHYTGDNMLKFVSLFHAPKRTSPESIYNMTKTGNSIILKNTISEDVVPIGMAVYRALSTDLDNLGDQRHLSPDGTHTQEGLPCLLQTYVALLWVLDQLGINKSIYNCDLRMTTDIYTSIHVPGPNLGSGVITGTDAQNILAQEVAIKAFKEGKKFVNENLSNY